MHVYVLLCNICLPKVNFKPHIINTDHGTLDCVLFMTIFTGGHVPSMF